MVLAFVVASVMLYIAFLCNQYDKKHEDGTDWERSKGMMVGWLGGLLFVVALFTYLYIGMVTFK